VEEVVYDGLRQPTFSRGVCWLRACSGQTTDDRPSPSRESASAEIATDTGALSRMYMGGFGFEKAGVGWEKHSTLDYVRGGTLLSHMACGKLYSKF